jgi:hypothetical protein
MYERDDIGEFVLVTGDRGCLDLVHRLASRQKTVRICALKSALAKELSDTVGSDNVISIEELLGIEPATPEIPIPGPLVVNGKADWTNIIRKFAALEERLPFVGLKLARDKYGFGQEIINEGIELGVFKTHGVDNPNQPYQTTALKLDRASATVKKALSTS